jgi:hypothetical protein
MPPVRSDRSTVSGSSPKRATRRRTGLVAAGKSSSSVAHGPDPDSLKSSTVPPHFVNQLKELVVSTRSPGDPCREVALTFGPNPTRAEWFAKGEAILTLLAVEERRRAPKGAH